MKIRPNLHTMIMMAGPSGAGKSSLATRLKLALEDLVRMEGYPSNVPIVSSDETRRWLLGYNHHRHDPIMMRVNKQTFELMRHTIDSFMQWPIAAPFIIVDATNLTPFARQPFLDLAKKHHYAVDLVVLDFDDKDEYEKFLPIGFNKEVMYKHIQILEKKFNVRKKDFREIYKVRKKDFSKIRVEVPKLDYWKSTFLTPRIEDVYIFADIHGCLTEFQVALRDLDYEIEGDKLIVPEARKNDVIVLLGDLIDKGPNSAETIDFVHANLDEFIVVEGNHERFILQWFDNKITTELPEMVLEKYFTCTHELKDDQVRLKKFREIMEVALPFIQADHFFANHAPCKSKYFGKVDLESLRSQRNFRIPRVDVTEGTVSDEVIAMQKKAWEVGLKFWESQAEYGYPWHFVGHLPLSTASRVKNQFIIDGGLPNGGTLITAKVSRDQPPYLTHTAKRTDTKYKERLFTIFDYDKTKKE